jgi:hypothetical protein
LKKPLTKKGWWSGSRCSPEFKPSTIKKKKKKSYMPVIQFLKWSLTILSRVAWMLWPFLLSLPSCCEYYLVPPHLALQKKLVLKRTDLPKTRGGMVFTYRW